MFFLNKKDAVNTAKLSSFALQRRYMGRSDLRGDAAFKAASFGCEVDCAKLVGLAVSFPPVSNVPLFFSGTSGKEPF